jgi:nitroreductase
MDTIDKVIGAIGAPETFDPSPVGKDEIEALFGAARVAPSADNVQIWRFVMAGSESMKNTLLGAIPDGSRKAFSTAPLLVAAMADPWFIAGARKEQPFFMIDVPIAISHIVLMAAELGLACRVEFDFDEEMVKAAVAATKDHRAVAVLAIGKSLLS